MDVLLIKRICPHCHKEYYAYPQRLKWGRQVTCSRKCSYAIRIRKMADANIGKTPWNKGRRNSRPVCDKPVISIKFCKACNKTMKIFYKSELNRKKFCSKKCFYLGRELKNTFQKGHAALPNAGMVGKKHTERSKKKISDYQRTSERRGDKIWNWKGGTGTKRHNAMGNWQYKTWRSAVFARDNYTCQICDIYGGYLHADHLKPWADYPKLRYDVNNGRTLCRACHFYITFKRKMPSTSLWGLTRGEK